MPFLSKSTCRCCWAWIWELLCKYVRFKKAAIFICALAFANKFVDNAFTGFLISYVQELRKEPDLRKATALVNAFHGVAMFLCIVFQYILIDAFGIFMLLIAFTPFLVLGVLLLWVSTWPVLVSHDSSIRLFYPALLSLAIGIAGCETAQPFLVYQFPDKELEEEVIAAVAAEAAAGDAFSQKKKLEEHERTIETRANVWWYAFVSVGSIMASTFTSGLDWEKALMVSLMVSLMACLFFYSGNFYYIKPPTKVTLALASEFKEAIPFLIRLLPLSTIFLVYSLLDAAGDTFFIQQSFRLDDSIDIRVPNPIHSFKVNRIPLSSFYILKNFTSVAISLLADYLIETRWSTRATTQKLATFVRICIGMVMACGCCIMAWWVEIRRLKLIHDSESDFIIPMKILWLAPQFLLLGMVKGLVGKAQRHLFNERVPLRFMIFESPFNQSVMCIGRFLAALSVLVARNWIRGAVEESRVDKYLLMLAILFFYTFGIYLFLSFKFDCNIKEEDAQPVINLSPYLTNLIAA